MKRLIFTLLAFLANSALYGALTQPGDLQEYQDVAHIDWRGKFRAKTYLPYELKRKVLNFTDKESAYHYILLSFWSREPIEVITESCIDYAFINDIRDLKTFCSVCEDYRLSLSPDQIKKYQQQLNDLNEIERKMLANMRMNYLDAMMQYVPCARINAQHTFCGTVVLMSRLADEKRLRILLEQPHLNLNIRDLYGRTILITALTHNNRVLAKLLLTQYARFVDVNINRYYVPGLFAADTALLIAVKRNDLEMIQLLLQHRNIDVNRADERGNTPLMSAVAGVCDDNSRKIVELLLRHQEININAQDEDGNTALICAVKASRADMVKLLLQEGTLDINIKNKKGNSALRIAQREFPDVVQLLQEDPRNRYCILL